MRLWTLHPRYLDAQLARFRAHPAPRAAINACLSAVQAEATARGYEFDRSKVGPVTECHPLFGRVRGPVADRERS